MPGLKFECGQGWTGTSLTFTGSKSTGPPLAPAPSPDSLCCRATCLSLSFSHSRPSGPVLSCIPSPCLFVALLHLLLGHCHSLSWTSSRRCFRGPKIQVFQQSPRGLGTCPWTYAGLGQRRCLGPPLPLQLERLSCSSVSCKRFHVCCCLNKGPFLHVRKGLDPKVGCNPVQVLHSVHTSSLNSVPSETDSVLSLSSPC